jgi:hypothetical protein
VIWPCPCASPGHSRELLELIPGMFMLDESPELIKVTASANEGQIELFWADATKGSHPVPLLRSALSAIASSIAG